MTAQRTGLAYATGAFALWGIFPLYFHLLDGVSPFQILAYRAVWSAAIALGIGALLHCTFRDWWAKPQRNAQLRVLLASAFVLGTNWGVYIYAVTTGHVLQASLGYFICPLVVVALGVLFLRERLSLVQRVAIALAAIGVAQAVMRSGSIPWLGLYLALSFGSYGLLRKRLDMDPLLASGIEAVFIGIPGAFALAFLPPVVAEVRTHALLSLSGFVSLIPLVLYVLAGKRLPYSTLGLMQYITPTLQLAVAVLAFGESVTSTQGWMFAGICTGLALLSLQSLRNLWPSSASILPQEQSAK